MKKLLAVSGIVFAVATSACLPQKKDKRTDPVDTPSLENVDKKTEENNTVGQVLPPQVVDTETKVPPTQPVESVETKKEEELKIYVSMADVKCPEGTKLPQFSYFSDRLAELQKELFAADGENIYKVQSSDVKVLAGDYLFWYMSNSEKAPRILRLTATEDGTLVKKAYLEGHKENIAVIELENYTPEANLMCVEDAPAE
ncbi:hypothetical protein [Pseudobacteriovorax antillogorgiicola]|uniref:Lipoprotein n=1 Tax=Pseudobacteriovorax antillogorgiicola TaxID=1513793 RepID=A0A1Y6BB10_9BACT|nr:hypothetical protein [Pseudobacteriovorax antillogorgiicola]TCS57452.1 hypothetical protein EDD56_103192 [Pseudobacteriovorax antillogorgiicola]SMF00881.1 hypothetical protein SAMN06296036_103141 [Pseudobacteriovorax antillogorgiicola]